MRILTAAAHTAMIDGIQRAQFDFCRELAARGHEVDLVYADGGDNLGAWSEFATSAVQDRSLTLTPRTPVRVVRQAARNLVRGVGARADVIYCHRVDQLNWAGLLHARRRQPVVFHAHNSPPGWFSYRSLRSPGAQAVAKTVTASAYMASEWRARSTHGTNVVTIPYGIDTDHFRPPTATERQEARAALGLPEDAFVVVFFGRIEPPKGVHVLVDAFGRLVDRCGGDPRLVLLGGPGKSVSPDEAARYREELASACDPGRTQWLAPRRNVVPVVHAADVVVVPSLWAEPFGLVVSESMACGVPVVASRVGGIPEQYGGEFAGLLVEPGDPDALADRLASLIRWRTETPSLGERLRAHVEAARSLPGMTDSLEQLLLDVCH